MRHSTSTGSIKLEFSSIPSVLAVYGYFVGKLPLPSTGQCPCMPNSQVAAFGYQPRTDDDPPNWLLTRLSANKKTTLFADRLDGLTD